MASPTATPRRIPNYIFVIGAVFIALLILGVVYLNRPVPRTADQSPSAEATAYLPNLQLSDVNMKATENFMKQQVVEIEGKITNKGPRQIQRIDVYCIFYGVDGKEVHRERVPVVRRTTAGTGLDPNQTRSFRLPFDSLPETWNQAMPHLVIAQIAFGS
jgi:hypothetical protein